MRDFEVDLSDGHTVEVASFGGEDGIPIFAGDLISTRCPSWRATPTMCPIVATWPGLRSWAPFGWCAVCIGLRSAPVTRCYRRNSRPDGDRPS
jgi:hypothetical protein